MKSENVCMCSCHCRDKDHFCKNPTPCCDATGEKYLINTGTLENELWDVDWVRYHDVRKRLKNPTKRFL